ncbi:zf-CCHC domain-containing protein, partial [Tanacetum coccineum]
LDEGLSSNNYVRKFLRALSPKWRAKVMAIEESKDLSSLAIDELIGNLKVHEVVMKKDFEIYRGKNERVKSISLKAKKESRYDETSTSGSDDEEFAMAIRNFKKFFRRKGKSDQKCFSGDPNHLIGDCTKPPRNKDQKAFIGGSWSDSENEVEDKINDETCLMVQSSNEVTLDSFHYSDNASSLDDDKLNEKIKKLERNKGIDVICESCQELKLENAKLKETQIKLVKFDKSANSLKAMLNNQKSSSCKIGLGFDSGKASTSETKPMSFVGSSAENSTDGSTIKVHGSTILGSVNQSGAEKVEKHIFSPPMSLRSDFVITSRALPNRTNISDDQRETRGMFKNLAQALHNSSRINSPNIKRKTIHWVVKTPTYVNLESSSKEHQNEKTPSPPPRKKSLSLPHAPSKSTSSRITHYTSSSSLSESSTPIHVAPLPKLRFVIPMKQEPQELSP